MDFKEGGQKIDVMTVKGPQAFGNVMTKMAEVRIRSLGPVEKLYERAFNRMDFDKMAS